MGLSSSFDCAQCLLASRMDVMELGLFVEWLTGSPSTIAWLPLALQLLPGPCWSGIVVLSKYQLYKAALCIFCYLLFISAQFPLCCSSCHHFSSRHPWILGGTCYWSRITCPLLYVWHYWLVADGCNRPFFQNSSDFVLNLLSQSKFNSYLPHSLFLRVLSFEICFTYT